MMFGRFLARDKAPGFILTELVIVIGLFAIAISLAWPKMNGGLEELYLRQTANHLVRDIHLVQQQAMNNPSGGWKLSFITTQVINGQYTNVQYWTISCYNNAAPDIRQLPPGISYLGTNFHNEEIRFTELGVPLSAGHVGIRNSSGHTLYVIVAPVTGKVRIDTQPPL